MTINELNTKKTSLIVETRNIVETAKKEKREMTVEEQQLFDNNLKEIENLKLQIADYQQQLLDLAMNKSEEKEDPKEEETPKTEETPENEETPKTEETPEVPENEEPLNEDQEVKEDLNDDKETSETNDEEDPVNEETPKDEEDITDENSDENKTKRNFNIHMNTNSIAKEIRSAIENGIKEVSIPAEKRMIQVTTSNGIHDDAIPTDFQGLMEPLYEDSLYQKAGFRIYSSLPMGDIRIPILGPSTVNFAGEVAQAATTTPSVSSILLQPHRLTAVLPYSRQMVMQDEIGLESALQRDIYNALINKLNQAIFSSDAATTTRFAGMFNGVTPEQITDFSSLCELEADVDDSNANGEVTYLLNNHAKAKLRCMVKGNNNTGMVYDRGTVDGTPSISTGFIPEDLFAVGDFSNCVVAQFGEIQIVIDETTLAHEATIRLIVNAWFDFKRARTDEDVIVFGQVADPSTGG